MATMSELAVEPGATTPDTIAGLESYCPEPSPAEPEPIELTRTQQALQHIIDDSRDIGRRLESWGVASLTPKHFGRIAVVHVADVVSVTVAAQHRAYASHCLFKASSWEWLPSKAGRRIIIDDNFVSLPEHESVRRTEHHPFGEDVELHPRIRKHMFIVNREVLPDFMSPLSGDEERLLFDHAAIVLGIRRGLRDME